MACAMMAQRMGLRGTGLVASEIIAVTMLEITMPTLTMPATIMPTPTIPGDQTAGATLTQGLHATAQRQIPRHLTVMPAFAIGAREMKLPEIVPETIQALTGETKMRVPPGSDRRQRVQLGSDPRQRVRPIVAAAFAMGTEAVGAVNAITNSGVTLAVVGLRYCAPGTGSSSF